MSSKIAILSFISAALAAPHVHNHGHQHLHKRHEAPYPVYNSTHLAATGTGVAPTTTLPLTTTITDYSTVVDYVTLTRSKAKDVGAADVATSANAADTVCGGTVTSTYTNKITVTVTAGGNDATLVPSAADYPSSAAESFVYVSSSAVAESSVVAPAPTSEQPAYTPEPSTTPEEPAYTSAYEVETTSAAVPVEPSSAAEVPTSAAAPETSAAPVTSAAPAPSTPASSGGYGGGKRGLAYNDASLCSVFEGDNKVGWAYNWGQISNGLASSFEFVPMLWGDKNGFADSWEKNAKASIDSGNMYLLGMNEPDHNEQALMTPATGAAFFKEHLTSLKDYNGGVKLGSPAVTNGGGDMGLTWLTSFMGSCSDCKIDFCAVHWYDSVNNVEYFKKHMQDAQTACGGKPIWVTEFGTNDGTTDQISEFLSTVMTWMDSQDFIERYSYFMVDNQVKGIGNNVLGSLYAST